MYPISFPVASPSILAPTASSPTESPTNSPTTVPSVVPTVMPTEAPSEWISPSPSIAHAPITCSDVSDASVAPLVGQVIGSGEELCVITDATTCTTCACSYYVRYRSARQHQLCFYVSSIYLQYGIRTSVICSTDSGLTWLGLSFEGTPGGSGCPGNGDTADAAKEWLLTKYIGQGYCCSTPSPLAGEIQFQTECMVLWFQSVPFFCQPPLRNPIFLHCTLLQRCRPSAPPNLPQRYQL